MYNIPLAGSTVATSPLPQPVPGADMLASFNALAADINTNIGGRVASLTASTNSVTSTGALVVASLPIANLGAVLAPRGTAASGAGIRCTAWGTYGATTTPKSISLVFGATSLVLGTTGTTTTAGMGWYGSIDIRRTAASSQFEWGVGSSSSPGPTAQLFAAASESEAAAATFAVVGTSTAAVAGDIVVKGMEIFWLP